MLNVAVRAFEAADADVHAELAQRAYAAVRAGERPRESAARRAHLHGDANPAGRAVVAVASVEGRVVGQASGLPARFVAGDGRACTGWQVGGFVVDPGVQRQGVGRALVAELTRDLAARASGFVYTFPNPRSRPLFERHGYVHAATIPTRVVVSRRARADAAVAIEASAARALVASIRSERGPGFVRDGDAFAWRFLAEPVAGDYRFARVAHPLHGELVVAAARHRWRGLAFAVLADAFPAPTARNLPLAVRGAAVAGDSALVYVTTNLPAIGTGITALGTRIPARLDPRPVELLVLPGGAVAPAEVAAAPILTADWMGF